MLRIVTVDARALIRAGIREVFARLPDMSIVGEASCSADALGLCEQFHPDLLLFDGALPGGLMVIAQLRERRNKARVLLLTEQVDGRLLSDGLQLGIAGYLLKQIEPFELAQAVRSAAGGLLTLAPEAVLALGGQQRSYKTLEQLSAREQAVLELLMGGMSNEAIAARLCVSCATVKFHLRNIFTKLGVRTRVEAIALCYQEQRQPAELLAGRVSPFYRRPRRGLAV